MAGLLLSSNTVAAKDLGVHGAVFGIKETDLLELIQGKLARMDAAGEITKQQHNMRDRAVARMETPPAAEGVSRTAEEKVFFFDPSITLDRDLADHEGRVFARAGTKVNPFDHINLTKQLLFIQGSDNEQVEWAFARQDELGGKAKVIFVDGKPLETMRNSKKQVFFDQNGSLIKFFGITQVPAAVSQDGDSLKIEELMP